MNIKIILLLTVIKGTKSQSYQSESRDREEDARRSGQLIWCTVNQAEQKKCLEWEKGVGDALVHQKFKFQFALKCIMASDKDKCMGLIANNRADLITLDPGEVYIAGRYNSLVPIMAERYGPTRSPGYYSVAVVKKHSTSPYISSPLDLKNSKACFPGVGQMAGWVVPISRLLENELLDVKDCNNMVKTAAYFFNSSCAPNALIDKHNPSGDNPLSMCSMCKGRCSGTEPYSNFDGAFKCLLDKGDVAFLKHNTVEMMINHMNNQKFINSRITKNEFELLCPKGGRAAIDAYKTCNWGYVPAHAVVTISSVLPEKRAKMQQFLIDSTNYFVKRNPNFARNTTSSSRYSPNNIYNSFAMFGEHGNGKYEGSVNLIFSDDTTELVPLDQSRQTFSGYLGGDVQYFDNLKKCPVPNARFCVTSEYELKKCIKMKTAFRAQTLKPQLSCVRLHSSVGCMKAITEGYADLVMLDSGDLYRAGHKYNLIPIVAEQYNLDDESYYVVAIAKQSDKDTDLLYLKGKRSCHTGYGTAAGWVVPISFLLTNKRMRSYGCDSAKAASEFFQKSCAPGALSADFATGTWRYGNLCDLCHGSSFHFCSRDSSEPFYGHSGAMRCLVEGGGQIAFAKHTTILENTAGRNPSKWSRNVIPDDFELLCRDGTRAAYDEYETCNLGKVASNAIVTSANKPKEHIEAYINLFILAQQLYGSKYSKDYTFKMFVSDPENKDLIFQDATSQLKAVSIERRNYKTYLGHDFINSMKIVDCASGAFSIHLSCFVVLIISFVSYIVHA